MAADQYKSGDWSYTAIDPDTAAHNNAFFSTQFSHLQMESDNAQKSYRNLVSAETGIGGKANDTTASSLYPTPPTYTETGAVPYLGQFDADGLTQSLGELQDNKMQNMQFHQQQQQQQQQQTQRRHMHGQPSIVSPTMMYPSPPCYAEPQPGAYMAHFDPTGLSQSLIALPRTASQPQQPQLPPAARPSSGPPTVDEDMDKRQRNTLASARFRAKKRQREEEMKAEARAKAQSLEELQARVAELEAENKFLKRLLLEKTNVDRANGHDGSTTGKNAYMSAQRNGEGT